jgi:hypothetical protein
MVKAHGSGKAGRAVSPMQGSSRGGSPRKHIPLRTCVSCRQTESKRELVRLVRTPSAGVVVDPTGKLAGRGAYLCRNRSCWEQGLRSPRLGQALKTTLSVEEIAALRAFAATLPDIPTMGIDAPEGALPSSEQA